MRRLAALLVPLLAVPVHAQGDSWAGKTVITIRSDIRITNPGVKKQLKSEVLLNDTISYRVLADKDGQIQVVTTQGVTGWFDKADAVPVDRAVAHFSNVLHREPNNVAAYQKRAHAWELRGDYELAIRDAKEMVRLSPSDPAGWITRGNFYSSLRKYDQAIGDFGLAIRLALRPRNDGALVAGYHNRAEAWIGKKLYTKAIEDLDAALDLDPKLAPAYNYRGLAHFLNQEYDKALQDFAKSQKLDPSNGWLYKNRAWMLATCKDAKQRDGQKAVELAQKALELEPHPTHEFHEALAAAYAEDGRFGEAIRRQLRALEDPLLENDETAAGRLALYRQKKAYRQP